MLQFLDFRLYRMGPMLRMSMSCYTMNPGIFPLFCIDPPNWKFTFTPQITFFYCNFPLISTAWGVTTFNRHIFVSKIISEKEHLFKGIQKNTAFQFSLIILKYGLLQFPYFRLYRMGFSRREKNYPPPCI